MRIEVLHIEDCPNWEAAGARVREALAQLGDVSTPLAFHLIVSPQDAAATGFAGSPTITVDGEDLFPSDGRTADLACRIYATPDGFAGLPTVRQVIDAIGSREP